MCLRNFWRGVAASRSPAEGCNISPVRMERVTFRDVSAVREIAATEFSRMEAIITALLPPARIEHVGGTALPRGITKGDLDIQVRVAADDFRAARVVLGRAFAPDPDNVWVDGAASFRLYDGDQHLIHPSADDSVTPA